MAEPVHRYLREQSACGEKEERSHFHDWSERLIHTLGYVRTDSASLLFLTNRRALPRLDSRKLALSVVEGRLSPRPHLSPLFSGGHRSGGLWRGFRRASYCTSAGRDLFLYRPKATDKSSKRTVRP